MIDVKDGDGWRDQDLEWLLEHTYILISLIRSDLPV